MSEFIKPDNLNVVWASGGDRLFPGTTKYASGWGVEIPPRQYFNEIDYKQDQMLAHINQHGIAVWDNETEYQAGKSYAQGSDGQVYKAVTTNRDVNPVGDVTGSWQVAFMDGTSGPIPLVATATQARDFTDNTVFISPLQLANAFAGSNQSLATTGSQTLPGGLVLKWGQGSVAVNTATISTTVVTFTQSFPNNCFFIGGTSLGSANSSSIGGSPVFAARSVSKNGFTAVLDALGFTTFNQTCPFNWYAIGN